MNHNETNNSLATKIFCANFTYFDFIICEQ